MPQGRFVCVAGLVCSCLSAAIPGFDQAASAQETMNVGFLWHMHQPQYRPGENVLQTDASGAFSFSITDVHNQRLGPYTTWPRDAVQS